MTAQTTEVHRFDTAGPVAAAVEQVSGRLEVRTGPADAATVSVEAVDTGDALAVAYAAEAKVSYDGHALRVALPHPRALRRHHPEILVRLTLPVGSDLEVKAAALSLTTDGPLGTVTVASASGRVALDETQGPISVHTAAGDIEIGAAGGHVKVASASAAVRIGRADAGLTVKTAAGEVHVVHAVGEVRVETGAGSIQIDRLGAGRARLHGAMGSIEVGVAPDHAVLLDLKSALGRVDCELDAHEERPASGAGEIDLHANTAMGRVHVFRSVL
jgi:hypothetical protein